MLSKLARSHILLSSEILLIKLQLLQVIDHRLFDLIFSLHLLSQLLDSVDFPVLLSCSHAIDEHVGDFSLCKYQNNTIQIKIVITKAGMSS